MKSLHYIVWLVTSAACDEQWWSLTWGKGGVLGAGQDSKSGLPCAITQRVFATRTTRSLNYRINLLTNFTTGDKSQNEVNM